LGRNTTLTDRTLIWKAVLSIHINPLLGTGFESFWLGNRLEAVWNMSVKGIQEAHNGYLELYLNLGFVGLFLFGAMIVAGYRHAFVAFRRDPHEGRFRLAFLTAALVYSLTEAGFRMMTPIWLVLILAVTGVPSAVLAKVRQQVPAASWTRGANRRQIRILQ
jgi:O-antigen ligase